MKRLLLCFLPFVCQAAVQFSGLAPNQDGSILYFSSTLRLRGTAQSFDAKIFRIAAAGPELVRSQDPGFPIGWTTTNFYNLIGPRISSDGSAWAFTGTRGCYGGSGCLAVQTAYGTVLDRNGKELSAAPGYVDLSPNGHYAFFFARNTFASIVPPGELVDVTAGVHTVVPYSAGPGARRRVANDGTVAVRSGQSIRLWQPQAEQTIPGITLAPGTAEPLLMIAADAQRLVYQAPAGLSLYDRRSAAEQIIVSGTPVSVSISDDARVIVYVSALDGQAYLASPQRQLTHEPDLLTEVALSGDGRVCFGATSRGRLLRIDLGSGSIAELVPRTPFVTGNTMLDAIAPGSLVPLAGSGLAASSGDVRIRIAGMDAPVISASPQLVWFQVPWELPLQDAARFEFLSGDSPFETGPGTLPVRQYAPHFFANGIDVLAVHQDWSALVTAANPARAGEVVHFYFNGLGPVSPPVKTGDPAPADPPAQITGALRCQLWDGAPNDTRIYFAGLAPAMVGIYQVSLQVPAGLRVAAPTLACDLGPESEAFATLPVVSPLPIQ